MTSYQDTIQGRHTVRRPQAVNDVKHSAISNNSYVYYAYVYYATRSASRLVCEWRSTTYYSEWGDRHPSLPIPNGARCYVRSLRKRKNTDVQTHTRWKCDPFLFSFCLEADICVNSFGDRRFVYEQNGIARKRMFLFWVDFTA